MKHLFLSALALALSAAHADRLPSQLPDGKYDSTCTNISISKAEGSSQKRYVSVSRGTVVASTFENVYTERQSVTDYVKDGSGVRTQVDGNYKRTLKLLAKDYYLQTIEDEARFFTDMNEGRGYDSDDYQKHNYTLVTRVENGFEVNINKTIDGGPVSNSASETFTTSLPDGTIEVTSYIREPFKTEARKIEDYEAPARETTVSTQVCRYKPAK